MARQNAIKIAQTRVPENSEVAMYSLLDWFGVIYHRQFPVAGRYILDAFVPALQLDIEVDGGINFYTARAAYDEGANVFVAGTSIFGKKDRVGAIKEILSSLK
jgi:very-short-patch-repair endonuclease